MQSANWKWHSNWKWSVKQIVKAERQLATNDT